MRCMHAKSNHELRYKTSKCEVDGKQDTINIDIHVEYLIPQISVGSQILPIGNTIQPEMSQPHCQICITYLACGYYSSAIFCAVATWGSYSRAATIRCVSTIRVNIGWIVFVCQEVVNSTYPKACSGLFPEFLPRVHAQGVN